MKRNKYKTTLENKKVSKQEGKSEVDLEGEDFYKSTPVVTNYYFHYK